MHARVLLVTTAASLALAATAAAAPSDRYTVRNMVSNDTAIVPAERADPLLVNPWGLASSASSPWWPANQGSNTSTITPATNIPNATRANVPGGPTGVVAGPGGTNFLIPGPPAGASNFIFNTLGGEIRALARRHPEQRRAARDLARERRRGLHGPHDRDALGGDRPAALRGRLRQQPDRHRQRAVAARQRAGRVRRPEPARRLRRLRDPDGRQPHLRHLRREGPHRHPRAPGRRPRRRQRLRPQRHLPGPRRQPGRRPERAVGHRAGARRTSGPSAATC